MISLDSFTHPIIGQEVVVPTYGLGRVVGFIDKTPERGIRVRPHNADYTIKFEPEDVKLVKINYE